MNIRSLRNIGNRRNRRFYRQATVRHLNRAGLLHIIAEHKIAKTSLDDRRGSVNLSDIDAFVPGNRNPAYLVGIDLRQWISIHHIPLDIVVHPLLHEISGNGETFRLGDLVGEDKALADAMIAAAVYRMAVKAERISLRSGNRVRRKNGTDAP